MPDDTRPGDRRRLLQKARSGDEQSLGELLQHHRPYLSLLARLKADPNLRAKLDDSDLVQETYTTAHRYFGDFRGETERNFTAWLREIMARTAANIARDHRRKRRDVRLERRLYNLLDQSSQMMRALADPSASPSDSAVQREEAVLLADALSQLPADHREVLVLRELEGKTLGEVADAMGRTPNAVQKLWARALERLRTLLNSPSR